MYIYLDRYTKMALIFKVDESKWSRIRCYRKDDIFVVPEDLDLEEVYAICLGGGAGGGGGGGKDPSEFTGSGGCGGSSGLCKMDRIPVNPGDRLSIHIGCGGIGGRGSTLKSDGNRGDCGGRSFIIYMYGSTPLVESDISEGGKGGTYTDEKGLCELVTDFGSYVKTDKFYAYAGSGGGFCGGNPGVGMGAGGGGAGLDFLLDIPGVTFEGKAGDGGDRDFPGQDATLPGTGGGGGAGGCDGGKGAAGMIVLIY